MTKVLGVQTQGLLIKSFTNCGTRDWITRRLFARLHVSIGLSVLAPDHLHVGFSGTRPSFRARPSSRRVNLHPSCYTHTLYIARTGSLVPPSLPSSECSVSLSHTHPSLLAGHHNSQVVRGAARNGACSAHPPECTLIYL